MFPEPSAQAAKAFPVRAATVPRLAAVFGVLTGGLLLLLWLINVPLLDGRIFTLPVMKANTALCMALTGAALLLAQGGEAWRHACVRALGFFIILIGIVTLCEYIFGLNLGVDYLFTREAPAGYPVRMSPLASFNFTLLGMAFLLLNSRRGYWWSQVITVTVLWISILYFMGYIYRVRDHYRLAILTGVSFDSLVSFIILSLGIIYSGRSSFTTLISSPGAGGRSLRHLLPAIIGFPILLGWIPVVATRVEYFSTEFGIVAFVVSLVAILSIVVFINARELHRLEAERQKVQEQLEATNRELNDFAHVVSHDLKAPLNAIWALVNWIQMDYGEKFTPKSKDQVELVLQNIKHIKDMITALLEYSKIGRTAESREKVDLNQVVSTAVGLLSPPENIRVEVEPGLPTVRGDKIRLGQVFQNLIGNSVKFMDKPQGEIAVKCAEQNGNWLFQVCDNGPGIPQADFERIFQVFVSLGPNSAESSGIGLAIAKKIIEGYGGRIWLRSEPPKGTTFFFTLPR